MLSSFKVRMIPSAHKCFQKIEKQKTQIFFGNNIITFKKQPKKGIIDAKIKQGYYKKSKL